MKAHLNLGPSPTIEFMRGPIHYSQFAFRWLKDGIDVKSNIDYRQDFVNGVASLVIEVSCVAKRILYFIWNAFHIGLQWTALIVLLFPMEWMR